MSAPPIGIIEGAQASRVREIDALRGLAALQVVFYHYTTRFGELFGFAQAPSFAVTDKYLGVEVFFVISGFVIWMTLERVRRPLDFPISRAIRLYPAYWIAIALTFLVTTLAPLPGRTITGLEAFLNFPMIQGLVNIPLVDGVYWTLEVELLFYFWIFLFWRWLGIRNPLGFAVGWMCVAALLKLTATLVTIPGLPYVARSVNADWAPFFATGVLVRYSLASGRFSRASLLAIGLAILLAGAIRGVSGALVVLSMACVLALIGKGHMRWLRAEPLVLLGTISYPLYLIHQNIGYVSIRTMLAAHIPIDAAIIVTVITMLCVAAIVTFCAEQPIIRWLRNAHRRTQAASPRAQVRI